MEYLHLLCICYVSLTVFAKVDESGSAAQWAEYLSYLDSMVEDGLLRFNITLLLFRKAK